MSFHAKLRKMLTGNKSYYERAAEAAAEASSKKAVRGRIGEKELGGLRKMVRQPAKGERIMGHQQTREKALKKVSFVLAFSKVAALMSKDLKAKG